MITTLHASSRQSGHTMLLVAMLSTVTLGLTAVAFRTTDDAVLTESFQAERDFRDEVISGALGRGVELLRTGDPPKNPYRYVETFPLVDGGNFYTMVTFEKQFSVLGLVLGDETYTVVAEPGTQADLIKYGPPPDSLGDDDDDGDDDGGNGNDEGGDDNDDDDDDDGGCGDNDGKSKGRGWGVGGIPPGSDEGGKNGWGDGDKPPGDPGPDKNNGKGGKGDPGCDD